MTQTSTVKDENALKPLIGFAALVGILSSLIVLLFFASLAAGPVSISFLQILSSLKGEDHSLIYIIIEQIRLPRAILAITVGATLGLAGAALQGLLRNPLAEPGLIGVSGCAALGAVIMFYTGVSTIFALALPLGGIAGALIAVAVIYALAGRESSILTLVLAGVAVNAFAGALTTLALSLSPNPYAAFEIFFWLLGSLADRSLSHVYLSLPLMALGWVLLLSMGRALDALTLGEDTARSLGFNLGRVQAQVVIGTALAVGAAVAVSGIIGFVGLVVPHLLRSFVGYQPGKLLLVSTLGGAVLTSAADIAVRYVMNGPELKLGVLTALIGAPFFLYLILQIRKEMR
jgi:iron complex transport system permease protein